MRSVAYTKSCCPTTTTTTTTTALDAGTIGLVVLCVLAISPLTAISRFLEFDSMLRQESNVLLAVDPS